MSRKQSRVQRGCGIDIDKQWLWASLYTVTPKGNVKEKFKQFSNDAPGIEELKGWLSSHKVVDVAFESTGVYWQLLFDKLECEFNPMVGNPCKMKGMRGYKTDRGDGRWIATLLRLGAIEPSFVPPRSIRELRLLTRQYQTMTCDRTKVKNRIKKTLRQVGITIDLCMKNLYSKTGRAMLEALIACKDAVAVASLGIRLKTSYSDLLKALEGAPLTPKLGRVLARYYRMMTYLDSELEMLWSEIEDAAKQYDEQISLLESVPGIGRKTAIFLIAEMGADMSVFKSVKNLASWGGLCSGNNSSGGQRKKSKATKGNKYLRTALVQAAWAAIRTQGSSYRDWYYSNKARLGHPNKAAFAVAHQLLRACYSVLSTGSEYTKSCSEAVERRARRIKKQLRAIPTEELEQELEDRRRKLEMLEGQPLVSVPLPV